VQSDDQPVPKGGEGLPAARPRIDTRLTRVERDSGQYSGARRVDRATLPPFDGGLGAGRLAPRLLEGGGPKWRSHGGNAKPTYGMLSVNPGRDLFSL